MKVNLRFFSTYRDIVGVKEMAWEVPKGASLQTLMKALSKRYPRLAPLADTVILAVNKEFTDLRTRLRAGDEVALMPPLGGG